MEQSINIRQTRESDTRYCVTLWSTVSKQAAVEQEW